MSYEQIAIACKNIGYDLSCGACAELFFTGGRFHACNEGCTTEGIARGREEERARVAKCDFLARVIVDDEGKETSLYFFSAKPGCHASIILDSDGDACGILSFGGKPPSIVEEVPGTVEGIRAWLHRMRDHARGDHAPAGETKKGEG